MREIKNLKQLYAAKLADLGPMDQCTYLSFVEQAAKLGVANPLLVIDVSFKGSSSTILAQGPKLITKDNWEGLLWYFTTPPSNEELNHMPRVHVVDGDKYAVPTT